MAKQHSPDRTDQDLSDEEDRDRIGGGPGASDANSGAGNATGIPDAETGMQAEDITNQGDVEEDRAKLFPENDQAANPGEDADEADADQEE
jgi:hypothetical protein